jgi:hypothetical protein
MSKEMFVKQGKDIQGKQPKMLHKHTNNNPLEFSVFVPQSNRQEKGRKD